MPDLLWLLVAFAAGAIVGWLGGRRLRRPELRDVNIAPPPALPDRPAPPEAAQLPPQPQEMAPAVSAEAPPAPANKHESLPAEVQVLLDKGQAFDAVKQLRLMRGGLAARALARQYLQPGAYPLPADIARLVKDGNKIEAIHRLCEQTHMGLKLAHEVIEHANVRSR